MKPSRLPALVFLLVLAFFYGPVLVLIANSFNASAFGTGWQGFSLRWYEKLWENREVWTAFRHSLLVAGVASVLAMILGTASALALHRFHSGLQKIHRLLIAIPLVMPEILMGVGLLVFFSATGWSLGFGTMIVAHVTFCLSYVCLVVLARLQDFDFTIIDAARDLGATRSQAFLRVLGPLLAPGILSGGLLAFTLSLDDFVVTFFVSGPGTGTLPLKVYSMVKHSREMPVLNALSTLLIGVTFLVVLLSRQATFSQSQTKP